MKVTYRGEVTLGALGEGASAPKEYLLHKENLDLAAKLDKFDMFQNIRVVAEDYEKTEDGTGIERIHEIHGNDPVVFSHQSHAAEHFLQSLRGIGILADEVGMGKTFEAGVVLSELANVVKLRSILIVARNINDWISVMGLFGIKEILTVKNATEVRENSTKGIPSHPMIIDMADFKKLKNSLSKICFDALVVDEAHNLEDDGMEVLSVLMKTKNEQNRPYCILVTGTPHKGNLENLFPLWYFFYKRGVNFGRFSAQDSTKETVDYTVAKEYFMKEYCYGAKTIAQFVDKSWERALAPGFGEEEHVKKFTAFQKREKGKNLSQRTLRKQFVELPENLDIKKAIQKKIGKDYNNRLIGSFMIRQSRTSVSRPGTKRAYNYYFCPLPNKVFLEESGQYIEDFWTIADSDRTDDTANRKFRYRVRWQELFTGKAISRYDTGEEFLLEDFAKNLYNPEILKERDKESIAKTRYKRQMCDTIFTTLEKLNARNAFPKKNSVDTNGFYYKNFYEDAKCPDIENKILFVQEGEDRFARKVAEFAKIVSSDALKDQKIVVFFDNDVEKIGESETEPVRLLRYLSKNKAYKEIKNRVVFFSKERFPDLSKEELEKKAAEVSASEFKEKHAAILFLAPPLGEGFNFQHDCHTVVNFSISADPVKTDQSIGRVDRIGQSSDMQIISLADMDKLEGYVLSFYNRIRMFSAWQSDVILVSGCNSETAMKQCPKCNKIVLATDDQSNECDTCGIAFIPVKGESYDCDKCNFRLVQEDTRNKVRNFAYLCDKGGKLSEPYREGQKASVLQCDKACAVTHCTVLTEANCELKRLRKKDILHKDLLEVCRVCRRQGLNTACRWCSVEYDVFGKSEDGKTLEMCCAECRQSQCKNEIFKVAFKADGTAVCPTCAKDGREGKLVSNTQKTFQSFVKKIWEFTAPDGTEDFVSNFSGEVQKVRSIIETLANK